MKTNTQHSQKICFKDPFSSISHILFGVVCLIGTPPLLLKAAKTPGKLNVPAMALFMLGLLLLYFASGAYHGFDLSDKINLRLKKLDHMMIYILIAGSYSPICLIGLHNKTGYILFSVVWGLAFLGILQAVFFIHAPKWVNSIIYIAMGWSCIFALPAIKVALCKPAFNWLFIGGIIYTIGGVIYALKLPLFNRLHKNFSSHDLFHLFCIGGSLSHYILMYYLLASLS